MDPPVGDGGGPAPKGAPLPPAPVTKLAVRLKSDDPFDPAIARAMVALDRNSALLTEEYLKSLKRIETAQVDVALASMRQVPPPPRIDEATVPVAEVFAPFAATAMPAVTVPTLKEVTVNTLPKSWKASRLIGGSAAPDAATIKLVAENFSRQLTEELTKLSINTALEIEIDALKKRATEVQALRKDFDEEIKKRREQLDKTMNNFVQALSRLAGITGGSAASGILNNLPGQISGIWAGVGPGQPLDSALTRITQTLLLAAQALETDLNRVKAAVGAVGSLENAATVIGQLNAQLAATENARVEEFNLRGNAQRQATQLLEANKRGEEALKKAEEEVEKLKRGIRDASATADDLKNRLTACEDAQAAKDSAIDGLQKELDQVKSDLRSSSDRAKKDYAEESARLLQALEGRRAKETKELTDQLNESLRQERLRALEALAIAILKQDQTSVTAIVNAVITRPYGAEFAEIQRSVNDFIRLETLGADYKVYSKRVLDAIQAASANTAAPYKYATDPYLVQRTEVLTRVLEILAAPGSDAGARVTQLANDPANAAHKEELTEIAKTLETVVETNLANQEQAKVLLNTLIEEVKKARTNSFRYRTKPKGVRPTEPSAPPASVPKGGDSGGGPIQQTKKQKDKIEEAATTYDAEDAPSAESPKDNDTDEKKVN